MGIAAVPHSMRKINMIKQPLEVNARSQINYHKLIVRHNLNLLFGVSLSIMLCKTKKSLKNLTFLEKCVV